KRGVAFDDFQVGAANSAQGDTNQGFIGITLRPGIIIYVMNLSPTNTECLHCFQLQGAAMNPSNGYTGAMRKVILLALAGLLGLVVLALALPPIRQRLLLVPLYVESTLSQYRPTPVVPTPPAESAHSPQELLQTRPLPSPTLAATNTPAAT